MTRFDHLRILERYILPAIFLLQAVWRGIQFSDGGTTFEISGILKPLVVALLMFISTNGQRIINFRTSIGLILSFGSIYFLNTEVVVFNPTLNLLISASLIFYISLTLVSILNLGKSFSILPSKGKLVSSGIYSIIRHPIYSSYLHILIVFVIIHPSLRNLLILIIFYLGLLIRSIEEEKALEEGNSYSERMLHKNRFFHYSVSSPVILILLFLILGHMRTNKTVVNVNISGPIFSLSPVEADDWSSFFVMNHIFNRFVERPGEFRSNVIISKKELSCENSSQSLLSLSCKRVVLKFKIRDGIKGCNEKEYTESHFRNEIETISRLKNWILPNFQWCNDSLDCFSFDNVPNIQNHLESIYLRFGWSLFDENDKEIGLKPNCFSVGSKDGKTISDGTISSSNWKINVSKLDRNADIFLFENSTSDTAYHNINFFNPIYYFLLINGEHNQDSVWINQSILELIKAEMLSEKIISTNKDKDYLITDFSNLTSTFGKYKKSLSKKTIAIPDYLESCSRVSNNLNIKVREFDPSIQFECVNISEYIEFGVKQGKSWDAFIGPLTPGLPGKAALAIQYFNADSTDSWLGKPSPHKTITTLVGISNGSMSLKKDRFCSIKPNALGLSDLSIDDFRICH